MSTGFLSRMLSVCQHQFAWPRRDENGNYYQSCVTCGSKYAYDWVKMCRTTKLPNDDPMKDAVASTHPSEHKNAWTPRERRLRYHVPVEIRVRGSEGWQHGTSENVSRSGLLLRCAMPLEQGQHLELKLEMPKELTGETAAEVICQAMVARVKEVPGTGKNQPAYLIACSIDDYKFGSKPPSRAAVQVMKIVRCKRQIIG